MEARRHADMTGRRSEYSVSTVRGGSGRSASAKLAGQMHHYLRPLLKPASFALVGANEMTLYTFDRDPVGAGKSVCNGPCAVNWPPLMASNMDQGSGDYAVITRDDGKKQWALKGKPLYYWIKDTKAGDKTGDGVQSVWHVIKP